MVQTRVGISKLNCMSNLTVLTTLAHVPTILMNKIDRKEKFLTVFDNNSIPSRDFLFFSVFAVVYAACPCKRMVLSATIRPTFFLGGVSRCKVLA
jgi:hypothetical protein